MSNMGKSITQVPSFLVCAGDQHADIFAKATDSYNSDGKTMI